VCGWSRGFVRGGSRTRGGEPSRGLVTQRTVWPLGVVFVSPRSRERPGIPDAIEDVHRQELISQAAVEALGIAVLLRTARFDVHGIDSYLPKPPTEGVGNELGTIVAADMPRDAAHRDELRERVDHVLTGDATIDFQGQALAGVLIDDRQSLQLPAAHRPVVDEVPAPDVVRPLGSTPVAAVCDRPYSSPFPLLSRHFQSLSLPQSKHSGQARSPSFFSKKPSDPEISIPRPNPRRLEHPLHQRCLVGTGLCLKSLTTPRLIVSAHHSQP